MFNLNYHDDRLSEATVEAQRVAELLQSARAELEAAELALHRAPAVNEALEAAIVEAEVEGTPAPTDEPLDLARLQSDVTRNRARVAALEEKNRTASKARSNAERDRYLAYSAAWQAYGATRAPFTVNINARHRAAALADHADVTIGQLHQAWLCSLGGHPARNASRAFASWLAMAFTVPDTRGSWPEVRKQATAWAREQDEKGKAA